ncbi:MAG: DEAD/DEAH box helicase, partial [Oscillospiraceae bacterium]
MTFQELNLLPQIQKAVDELGYESPTPIQEKAIPPVSEGRDLVGCAQTGTGKTAAFAIPLLQQMTAENNPTHKPIRALILTPTRELALQIKESFDQYGKHLPLRTTVIFGGVGQAPQVSTLQRGVDILVATPGRLNDLCNQGHIDLSRVKHFVLDEADRMLDMGFIHDVRKVLARLPDNRQTLLFSATMPQEITELSRKILRDPVRVEVTPIASTVDAIDQCVYKIDKANKRHLLAQLLQDKSLESVLVFTTTKHGADRVVRELADDGIVAMAIHGNKSQTARVAALEGFKAGKIRVLVATDIAARGIDISELSAVINYNLPNIPETYVHRIGRTGRAGHSGVAISFCNFDELPFLKDIEKLIGKAVPEIKEHRWPMEIFVATPKAVRQPRPPRNDRRPAAPTHVRATPAPQQGRSGGTARPTPAPQQGRSAPRSAPSGKPVFAAKPTAPGGVTITGKPTFPSKAPSRSSYGSHASGTPGRLVASADGRSRR